MLTLDLSLETGEETPSQANGLLKEPHLGKVKHLERSQGTHKWKIFNLQKY
jgi:hypothetical protein